jgi:hypothetical protein
MQRLREEREGSSTVADAARLLATMGAHQPSPARKARIRRALDRGRRRRRSYGWQTVLVAIALLGFATVAGATIGRYWLGPKLAKPAPNGAVEEDAPKKRVRRSKGTVPVAPVVPQPVAPVTAVPVPNLPVPSVPVAGAAIPKVPPRGTVLRPSSDDATPDSTEPPGDAALLVQGFKSLRHDHDPTRAGELAELYLQRHPDGVLAEEALGLAFEAAVAREDPRAATLAARYLERFPGGRFTDAAHRAQQRFAP